MRATIVSLFLLFNLICYANDQASTSHQLNHGKKKENTTSQTSNHVHAYQSLFKLTVKTQPAINLASVHTQPTSKGIQLRLVEGAIHY